MPSVSVRNFDRTGTDDRRRLALAHVTAIDRWMASVVQQSIAAASVRIELWDGTSPFPSSRVSVGDLIVRNRRTLFGLLTNPELAFGEAYMTGELGVRGSLDEVVVALTALNTETSIWMGRIKAALAWPNTVTSARRNAHRHYDLGNDFYQLWLDEQLVYTCAYYADRAMTLEEAQRAKLDLVCRKLMLRHGDTVLEAGCGWGALALHMAREFGVRVKAFNVSREQIAFARDRARREGLDGRVEFIEDDYRNASGRFDAFVSLGMLEHVGLHSYPALAAVLRRTLKRDGGRGLLHFIGRDVPQPLNAWIRRRIFPGAYPPTLAEVTMGVLAPSGMSVNDVDNLRLHYAKTLRDWSDRFAHARETVRERFGDEFARAWELYLAGSRAAFTTGWMQLFQVVFSPKESSPPVWSREEWYG
jgi:cyclopropane-fatty-acyl-phospholipid synthase